MPTGSSGTACGFGLLISTFHRYCPGTSTGTGPSSHDLQSRQPYRIRVSNSTVVGIVVLALFGPLVLFRWQSRFDTLIPVLRILTIELWFSNVA